jgi:signal transduction histidine kinase
VDVPPERMKSEVVLAQDGIESRVTADVAFINDALIAVTSDLDPGRAFTALGEVIRRLIPFQWLAVSEIREGVFRRIAVTGETADQFPVGEVVLLERGPLQEVVDTQNQVLVQDTSDPEFDFDRYLGKAGVRSYITSPLIADGKVFAALNCSFDEPDQATPERAAVLAALAPTLAKPIQHMIAFERLRESVLGLKEVNELKTDFLAMVAHELRTPLTLIAGYAEILRERWDQVDDEEKLRITDVLAQRSSKMASLVGDVLGVAAIESGAISYDIAPFDLVEMIREVVDEGIRDEVAGVRSPTGPGSTTVTIRAEEEMPEALADRRRQMLVLENVLWNAFIQTPVEDSIQIDVRNRDGALEIAITDRGPGLDELQKERVFQRFSRTPFTPGQELKGSGLGLYTSKHLVEAQGGDMWIETELGRGTVWYWTVPAVTH